LSKSKKTFSTNKSKPIKSSLTVNNKIVKKEKESIENLSNKLEKRPRKLKNWSMKLSRLKKPLNS